MPSVSRLTKIQSEELKKLLTGEIYTVSDELIAVNLSIAEKSPGENGLLGIDDHFVALDGAWKVTLTTHTHTNKMARVFTRDVYLGFVLTVLK